jgi:hypothetical protein
MRCVQLQLYGVGCRSSYAAAASCWCSLLEPCSSCSYGLCLGSSCVQCVYLASSSCLQSWLLLLVAPANARNQTLCSLLPLLSVARAVCSSCCALETAAKQSVALQLYINTTITVIFKNGSDPYSSLSPSEQQVRLQTALCAHVCFESPHACTCRFSCERAWPAFFELCSCAHITCCVVIRQSLCAKKSLTLGRLV